MFKPQKEVTKTRKLHNIGIITRIANFHYEIFQDERGAISIKPFLAYVATFYLCLALVANVVSSSYKASDALVNMIGMIIMACLGADTADKFSLKGKSSPPTEPPETQ